MRIYLVKEVKVVLMYKGWTTLKVIHIYLFFIVDKKPLLI